MADAMTPPERPEVVLAREMQKQAERLLSKPVYIPVDDAAQMLIRLGFDGWTLEQRAAEPLRGALELLNQKRTPPEYPENEQRWAGWVEGFDAARDLLRAALEATAPSTPVDERLRATNAGASDVAYNEAFSAPSTPEPAREGIWLLKYEDPDHQIEVFAGGGAEQAARRRFDEARKTWNLTLFRAVESSPSEIIESASTPEPALDVATFVRIMLPSILNSGIPHSDHNQACHEADATILRVALTSEPRAAAPQGKQG